MTINNLETEEETIKDAISIVEIPKVTLKEVEYETKEVKKIIKKVSNTKVVVDKVNKITTETSPSHTVYNMEIISEGKPFEVTVIDNKVTQEVVAVRSTEKVTKKEQTRVVVKPTTVKEVNTYGNTVIRTNDVKYIKSIKEVQVAVEQIKTEKKEVQSWNVDSVVTVDYGTQ